MWSYGKRRAQIAILLRKYATHKTTRIYIVCADIRPYKSAQRRPRVGVAPSAGCSTDTAIGAKGKAGGRTPAVEPPTARAEQVVELRDREEEVGV